MFPTLLEWFSMISILTGLPVTRRYLQTGTCFPRVFKDPGMTSAKHNTRRYRSGIPAGAPVSGPTTLFRRFYLGSSLSRVVEGKLSMLAVLITEAVLTVKVADMDVISHAGGTLFIYMCSIDDYLTL